MSIEKIKELYVLCSLDSEGKTVYLRCLPGRGKWEIVTDIEMASKCETREIAEGVSNCYDAEIGDAEWAIVPLIIQHCLVNES